MQGIIVDIVTAAFFRIVYALEFKIGTAALNNYILCNNGNTTIITYQIWYLLPTYILTYYDGTYLYLSLPLTLFDL